MLKNNPKDYLQRDYMDGYTPNDYGSIHRTKESLIIHTEAHPTESIPKDKVIKLMFALACKYYKQAKEESKAHLPQKDQVELREDFDAFIEKNYKNF